MTDPGYSVGVNRTFSARHYLIGGDWGSENELHAHHYRLGVVVSGRELDQHGYLLDIDQLKSGIEATLRRYEDRVLNDLPAFDGLNPSLEHFARILAGEISEHAGVERLSRLALKLWEDELAWAEYRIDLG